MGFSFVFPVAQALTRPAPQIIYLRRQTGGVHTQGNAYRNGFVSRYELLTAFPLGLAAKEYFCG
jgi:hypothetical protein